MPPEQCEIKLNLSSSLNLPLFERGSPDRKEVQGGWLESKLVADVTHK